MCAHIVATNAEIEQKLSGTITESMRAGVDAVARLQRRKILPAQVAQQVRGFPSGAANRFSGHRKVLSYRQRSQAWMRLLVQAYLGSPAVTADAVDVLSVLLGLRRAFADTASR